MDFKKLVGLSNSENKWKFFAVILVFILIAGTILSLLARITFLRDDIETRPRLAIVAPLNDFAGKSLLRGAELYVDNINKQGGVKGRQLELIRVEETLDAATTLVKDKRVIGVIGYLDSATLSAAAPIYAQAKLPLVTTLPVLSPIAGVISLGTDPSEEALFTANYARNIQQQRMMYVVRENGSQFDSLVSPIVDVYKRFDTPVQKIWTLSTGADSDKEMKALLEEIRSIGVGAVYVAASSELSARIVKGIRETGSLIEVFGPSILATNSFSQALKQYSGKDASTQSHGIVAATPVLFDTANDDAQRFQTLYQQKFQSSPDWLAVYAYDAAQIALANNPEEGSLKGVSGSLTIVDARLQQPIQMGIYNGESLISAPVQLAPIAKGASFNYIDALRQGRVLYVNNRFMFKTNVVYVGLSVNEISDVDRQKETATLDLSVWFRYSGKFSPQDLEIANALEPVQFGNPEEIRDDDGIQYRRYRIKQKFALNFAGYKRSYNQHVAGISFRHRQLNRNNLMYVVDVLGMPSGKSLLEDLQRRRVIKGNSDWMIDNAWISQDIVREKGDGVPQYVGMTGEQPMFSTITLGVLLKPETVAARDLIDSEYFFYIAIFGLVGIVAAVFIDRRRIGRFSSLQAWLLHLIFGPLLLLSVGNLAIDWAFLSWAPVNTRTLVAIYESSWWLLGARLLDMAIRRFVWPPLEARAERKVPNVMKVIVSILIFAFALAGVIAVVLNQTLTSLLATSGVLVMIIGLAIQSNIANVFSGIILNIERPFRVGDYIKINNVVGQVKDITWRTVRLESNEGPMVSLANSKVSEALMENFSIAPHGVVGETMFYTPPDADVGVVLEILTEAIANSESIIFKDDAVHKPGARFKGIVNLNGQWVASFSAGYRVKIMPKKSSAREELWQYVIPKFKEHGIPLLPARDDHTSITVSA